MAIQGIGAAAAQRLDTASQRIEGLGSTDTSFGDVLKEALGEVSQLQDQARDAIGAFLRGEPVELHEVMAATEEAGIALDLLIEIRNKLTEAYRSVINMQG